MTGFPEINRREWALFGLRWAIPLGLFLSFLDPASPVWQYIGLTLVVGAAAIVTNLTVLLVLLVMRWSRAYTWAAIAVDLLLSLAAVALGGPWLVWTGLVPAIIAALYEGWIPGLAAGLLAALGNLGVMIAQPLGAYSINAVALALNLVALPGAGLAVAIMSKEDPALQQARAEASSIRKRAELVSRLANEYMGVVYELADVLSASELDPKRVLRAAITFSVESLERMELRPPIFGAILLFADEAQNGGTVLRVAQASMSVPGSDNHIAVRGSAGIINQVVQSNEPAMSTDPKSDPELAQFTAFGTFSKTVMCLPVRTGNVTYGVMLIGSQDEDAFSELHLGMMRAVANQAASSLHNARLYGALLEQRDRLVEVEKQARAQLASDLHDGPTQGVAAITMRLNFIRKLMDKKPEKAAEELYQVEDVARRTTKEIRHMLFELRPKALEQGLKSGLEQLAAKNQETYDQAVEVNMADSLDKLLDEQTIQTLFSIAVETIANARKHAKSQIIRVKVEQQNNLLVMEVSDEGQGFDVETALAEARHREGHLGLINLLERAALIEGTLHIDSALGKGTRTTVAVPVEVIRHRKNEELRKRAEHEPEPVTEQPSV